ncbi:hypothetical protein [Lacticaseibacillus daqingensis]|uniref:hypothetical protein n=1 Tax=Lacticaseibacillus daqingensis TaxID=2486014 RepID=UPI000F78E7CF|nr:hypothetical protein [Lacticaseibacillus daqingensis]
MDKRQGSALLSAMMVLLVVTLMATVTLHQMAVWRGMYQLRLQEQAQAAAAAYRAWQAGEPPRPPTP